MKKSLGKFMALAMCGTVLQFGGCNFNRIVGSLVDHAVADLVLPILNLGGLLGV